MNRSFSGRPRSFRARPQSNYTFKRSNIRRERYINAAVLPEKQEEYQSTNQFSDFGLDAQIVENITRHGYTTPTPIQDQAIPVLMQNKDIVGIANTGTGKTAAFLLPLIHKILQDQTQGALILAPTRELAYQIYEEFKMFSYKLPIGVCLCIGGANISRQIFDLKDNPHFVIGTPGRIKDLMQRGKFDINMFTNIVLDEVDRMLDIGFRKDISFLISKLPKERLSAFFSATLNQEVEQIMKSFLRDPARVSVKTHETNQHITQDIVRIKPGENKTEVLYQMLIKEEFERVIVFGRTKHGINKLEEHLTRYGVKVTALHSNKSQGARKRSLDDFKRGHVKALLATDIAARGIDVDGVTHVINFDEPENYEDYVHRIGRTGRAGKGGTALTFIS